jgi:septal ring factor EnvC (AmiA/AmiB activator)
VLNWRLQSDGRERAWRTGRGLRELDAQLFDTRTRYRAVTEAMAAVPERNEEFTARIASLQPQLGDLVQRVAAARLRQGEYLASLAVGELEAQKARLAEYSVQAGYALAALYDRATAATVAPAGGVSP